jgi:hypothetical protein
MVTATNMNIISAILALIAGCAWVRSSRVTVIYSGGAVPSPRGSLPHPALSYGLDRKGRQIELIGTLQKQSKWNACAAGFAAGAAAFQAVAALLSATPTHC